MTPALRIARAAAARAAAALAAPAAVAAALAAVGCGAAPPTDAARQGDGSLPDVAWLVGAWQTPPDGGPAVTRERWLPARNGVMFGVGRRDEAGKLAFFEHLRIERRADPCCRLAYVASPMGGATTTFCLAEAGPQRLVFANAAHDFPQQISYERRGDGIEAAIAGSDAGVPKRVVWRLVVEDRPAND